MDNPFLKRATEQYRKDNEAFLSVVSPEPFTNFLGKYSKEGLLYDRLVVVQGTPGSGKTTLARVFEYQTVAALFRNPKPFRPLLDALVSCGAILENRPQILGCRLSLETAYRDFWEFPYPNDIKVRLMTSLIQARAVQSWLNDLTNSGVQVDAVEIVAKDESKVAVQTIGGTSAALLINRAQEVELALYQVVAAMVPPPLTDLNEITSEAYRPFDVIERFTIPFVSDGKESRIALTPLIILDDAHLLHPDQFELMRRWLMRRELPVARWVMTRLDILQPEKSLALATEDRSQVADLPGVTSQRDVIEIPMQSGREHGNRQRNSFRRMARDMADRYLNQMVIFQRHSHKSLSLLLTDSLSTSIPKTKLEDLQRTVDTVQARSRTSDSVRSTLLAQIDAYHPDGKVITPDIRLQMLSILMHRYEKRSSQVSLFDEVVENNKRIKMPTADSSVFEAACVQLHHKYGRPLYFGMDDLCDASSENAEQFLRLAATFVEEMAVKITRSKSPVLDANTQHHLLVDEAERIVNHWNFPKYRQVKELLHRIADKCKTETLKPNAWIGAGANSYGIPQLEFDQIAARHTDLAGILHYAVAYSAVSLVPHYTCKNEQWCLIELGGHTILRYGLTLRRGGFVEGSLGDLALMATGSDE